MFLAPYLTDDASGGELAAPPVSWIDSTPSIQPIGARIDPASLGNPAPDPVGIDIAGESTPGTLGMLGTDPSFSPYPAIPPAVMSVPSVFTIHTPPLQPLDIGGNTTISPVSGGAHLDPTAPPASGLAGMSNTTLLVIGAVALLILLNL